MAEKKQLLKKEKIKFSGIFDLEAFYKHGREWFEHNRYRVWERDYKQEVFPTHKKIEFKWECKRDIDEYSRFQIDVKGECKDVVEVEVKEKKKVLKLQKGDIKIEVSAWLVLDYDDNWEQTAMFKFMKGFYEKFIYKGTIDTLKEEVWKESWEFLNEMKAFLNLYKY
jgi:hypothetical protein